MTDSTKQIINSNPNDTEKNQILQVLTTYLLYERREETQLRIAFAALVQERHNHFHAKQDLADDDTMSPFTECGNEICMSALKILQDARKPRIELNDLSIEVVRNYNLKVQKAGRTCAAYLEEIDVIKKPEDGLLLKV